jgi:uncharacterized protein YukE
MATVVGGELPALRALKTNFERQSDTVEHLMRALSSELHSVYWKGGAAERFRADWEGEFQPALRRLAAALVDAAAHIGHRADRLDLAGN